MSNNKNDREKEVSTNLVFKYAQHVSQKQIGSNKTICDLILPDTNY